MTVVPGSATADDILDGHGSGGVAYRLEVEGWPCEWVSDERITHADGADGRRVFGGLSYEPLTWRERIVMQMSELICDGIKFKIVPPYFRYAGATSIPTDDGIEFLSKEVEPVDHLAVAVDHEETAFSFTSGNAVPIGTVYHIGTETIRCNDDGNEFERAIWSTQPQAHTVNSYDKTLDVYVYQDMPLTMEGRRCYLYEYGDGDDPAGDGRCRWRGLVAAVPYWDTDGITWVIDADPITAILNQNVAGAIVEANVIGIYHHYACPFAFAFHYDGDDYGPYYYTGHDINEEEAFANIGNTIASALGAVASAYIDTASIKIQKLSGGQPTLFFTRTAMAEVAFDIFGGSAILGFFETVDDGFQVASEADLNTLTGLAGKLLAKIIRSTYGNAAVPSTSYFLVFQQQHRRFVRVDSGYAYEGAPVSPLGTANQLIDYGNPALWIDPNPATNPFYSPWRIYVDTDFTGVEAVYIAGTTKPDGIYRLTSTGTDGDKFYIEVEIAQGVPFFGSLGGSASPNVSGFLGFLGKEQIVAFRRYGVGGLDALVDGLKLAARDHANAGDAPFITDADLADFVPRGPMTMLGLLRVYAFTKKQRAGEIIKAECMFRLHCLRLTADGRIEIVPLPRWTEATPVDALHTFDGDSIITPLGGPFPTHTPNKDGRGTMVEIQHVFNPRSNEHVDDPVTVQSVQMIPVTKGRGKAPHKIAPFSAPVFYSTSPAAIAADRAEREEIGRDWLAFFSINYSFTTFTAPYNKSGVLCGDIVSLTSPHILAGDGTKGVTGRRGVVVEKRENGDPRRNGRIEFTVQLTSRGVVGYAPSAFITDATDLGGDVWELEVWSGSDLNIAMSSETDGKVVLHFAVGDFVRVQRIDEFTDTNATGIVTAVDNTDGAETITVAFDALFDPTFDGDYADLLVLEYQPDNGSTATSSQRVYCYSAVADGFLADSSYARRQA